MINLLKLGQLKRCVSLLTILIFVGTETLGGAIAGPVPNQVRIPRKINKKKIEQKTTRLMSIIRRIPNSIGTINQVFEAGKSMNENEPFIIYIQDAHSNPEAQKNIYKLLNYLTIRIGRITIAAEGAKGPLHPEYFDVFPTHPEAGQAIIESLLEKGEISGMELYAWDRYRKEKKVPVYGVEEIEIYRDNLDSYRDLLLSRDEIDVILQGVRMYLEYEQSRVFNRELLKFVKERSRRKKGNYGVSHFIGESNLIAYLGYLQQQAKRLLQVDLEDPIEQIRFPNLIRLVRMRASEDGMNMEKVREEWKEVLMLLRKNLKDYQGKSVIQSLDLFARKNILDEETTVEDPIQKESRAGGTEVKLEGKSIYPRRLLEKLHSVMDQKDLDLSPYKQFWKSYRNIVYQAEINLEDMMDEMEVLEGAIIKGLAETDKEKNLIRQLDNFELLEKILFLELTRDEYQQVIARWDDITQLIRTVDGIDGKNKRRLYAYFKKGVYFYETARKRDQALVENALNAHEMQQSKSVISPKSNKPTPASSPSVIVMIAGGFHSDGIQKVFKDKGLSYTVLTPRISKTDHGQLYRNVMAGSNADLSIYFKDANPFLTTQQAILFKEMLEVGLPAIAKKYHLSDDEMSLLLKENIEAHPIFSKMFATSLFGKPGERFVRFAPKAGSESFMPQRNAIPRPLLQGDVSMPVDSRGQGLGETGRRAFDFVFDGGRVSIQPRLLDQERQTVDYGQMTVERGLLDGYGLPASEGASAEVPRAYPTRGQTVRPRSLNIPKPALEGMGTVQGPEVVSVSPSPTAAFRMETRLQYTSEDTPQIPLKPEIQAMILQAAADLGNVFFRHSAQAYLSGAVDTSMLDAWMVSNVLGTEGLMLGAGAEGFEVMLAAVESALGPHASILRGSDTPVHMIMRTGGDISPETHIRKLIPLLNRNLPNRLTLIIPGGNAETVRQAFHSYMNQLGLPGFVAERLQIVSMADTREMMRFLRREIARDDNEVGVLDSENGFLQKLGYVRGGLRFLTEQLNEDAAVSMTPSLIRELGAEAQYVVQNLRNLMRRYGIDADSLTRHLAHAAKVLQSFKAAA